MTRDDRLESIVANFREQQLGDGDCYYAEYKDMEFLIGLVRKQEKQLEVAVNALSLINQAASAIVSKIQRDRDAQP